MNAEEEVLDFGEEELYLAGNEQRRQQESQQHRRSQQTSHDDDALSDAISIGERSVSPPSHRLKNDPHNYNTGSSSAAAAAAVDSDRRRETDRRSGGTNAARVWGGARAGAESNQSSSQSRPSTSTAISAAPHSSTLQHASTAITASPAVPTATAGSVYAPDGTRLPPGWVTKMSTSNGELYYRNDAENLSSWDVPVAEEEEIVKSLTPPRPSERPSKVAVHPSRAALIPKGSNEDVASNFGSSGNASSRTTSSRLEAAVMGAPTWAAPPSAPAPTRQPLPPQSAFANQSLSTASRRLSGPASSTSSVPVGPRNSTVERGGRQHLAPLTTSYAPSNADSRVSANSTPASAISSATVAANAAYRGRHVTLTGASQFAPTARHAPAATTSPALPPSAQFANNGPRSRVSASSQTSNPTLPSPAVGHGRQFAPETSSTDRWAEVRDSPADAARAPPALGRAASSNSGGRAQAGVAPVRREPVPQKPSTVPLSTARSYRPVHNDPAASSMDTKALATKFAPVTMTFAELRTAARIASYSNSHDKPPAALLARAAPPSVPPPAAAAPLQSSRRGGGGASNAMDLDADLERYTRSRPAGSPESDAGYADGRRDERSHHRERRADTPPPRSASRAVAESASGDRDSRRRSPPPHHARDATSASIVRSQPIGQPPSSSNDWGPRAAAAAAIIPASSAAASGRAPRSRSPPRASAPSANLRRSPAPATSRRRSLSPLPAAARRRSPSPRRRSPEIRRRSPSPRRVSRRSPSPARHYPHARRSPSPRRRPLSPLPRARSRSRSRSRSPARRRSRSASRDAVASRSEQYRPTYSREEIDRYYEARDRDMVRERRERYLDDSRSGGGRNGAGGGRERSNSQERARDRERGRANSQELARDLEKEREKIGKDLDPTLMRIAAPMTARSNAAAAVAAALHFGTPSSAISVGHRSLPAVPTMTSIPGGGGDGWRKAPEQSSNSEVVVSSSLVDQARRDDAAAAGNEGEEMRVLEQANLPPRRSNIPPPPPPPSQPLPRNPAPIAIPSLASRLSAPEPALDSSLSQKRSYAALETASESGGLEDEEGGDVSQVSSGGKSASQSKGAKAAPPPPKKQQRRKKGSQEDEVVQEQETSMVLDSDVELAGSDLQATMKQTSRRGGRARN